MNKRTRAVFIRILLKCKNAYGVKGMSHMTLRRLHRHTAIVHGVRTSYRMRLYESEFGIFIAFKIRQKAVTLYTCLKLIELNGREGCRRVIQCHSSVDPIADQSPSFPPGVHGRERIGSSLWRRDATIASSSKWLERKVDELPASTSVRSDQTRLVGRVGWWMKDACVAADLLRSLFIVLDTIDSTWARYPCCDVDKTYALTHISNRIKCFETNCFWICLNGKESVYNLFVYGVSVLYTYFILFIPIKWLQLLFLQSII